MKKILSILLVALLLVGTAPAFADEEVVYRALYSGEVSSLNYLTTSTTSEFAIAANVIDTLIEYDRYGNIQPSLATSWIDGGDDGLTWTFTLRQDAKWVDASGNVVAPVTANDFVAAAKYILDSANASGTAKNLYSVIAGAEAYYKGTLAPEEGKEAAPKMAWDTVGIKALDDYTLQYTLIAPTPYFLSMVDYVCFMPVYEPFLLEKGEGFGLATGTDTLLYCGAYVLSEFKPQEIRVLAKNESNWDADKVSIDRLVFRYNKESDDVSTKMYINGEIDSTGIDAATAIDWLNDPEKADLIRPERPTSFYSYFYAFNFVPKFDEIYEPDNWAKAVVNENFRKSFYYGLDRVKVKRVTDANNAESLIFNTITPTNFVSNNGIDFTKTGALKAITELGAGTFQEAEALKYRDLAIAELTAAGVTFPIKVLMPYNSSSASDTEECQTVEQQLEALFGPDYIDIIMEPAANSSVLKTRRAGGYAFLKCNWGPDYNDPATFTDPFAVGNSYMFIDKNDDMTAVRDELYALTDTAKAITNDITARYEAFAEVEAYVVDHAIVIPFGFSTGGYSASRLDPFTMPYSAAGISNQRYKGTVLLDAPMNTDQYYDALDQWDIDREEAAKK